MKVFCEGFVIRRFRSYIFPMSSYKLFIADWSRLLTGIQVIETMIMKNSCQKLNAINKL